MPLYVGKCYLTFTLTDVARVYNVFLLPPTKAKHVKEAQIFYNQGKWVS